MTTATVVSRPNGRRRLRPGPCSSSRMVPVLLLVVLPAVVVNGWIVSPSSSRTRSSHTRLNLVSETMAAADVMATDPSATSFQVANSAAAISATTAATTMAASIDSFWQSSPYTAAAIACGFKASAADMIAQKNPPSSATEEVEVVEEEAPVAMATTTTEETSATSTDYKRNVAFLLYGSLYQGISQEFIYNHIYPQLFGTGTEIPVVLTKVAFDLCVQTTLLTLPMAYIIKGIIYGDQPDQSLGKYWNDIQNQQLLQKYFLLWGPVQCLTFSVVPEHYRVTFIAFVSFFWLIILSQISSSSNANDTATTTTNMQLQEEATMATPATSAEESMM